MKIIIYLTLLSGIVLSQDVITLKSGSTIKGTLDLKSIKNKSIRFMVKGTSKYNFYNKVAIAQIVGSNGKILYPNFIYANSESGLIHQPFVEHIPNKEYLLEFESLDEAESQGFHKCPACFDLRPRVSNYYTEIQLKSALYGSIVSSYEVLYEHEKLPVLREALDKVLGSWMEKRKYSDYRIEILKSNYPMSFSLPGGNIYLTSELVKLCETNEEFEAIIAREVVHIEKRHLLREYLKYQQGALIAAIVATVVGTTNNQRQELLKALSEFAQITLSAGFSRRLEEEADAIAMVYCMSRGLDKTPLLSILDKLKTRATTRLGYVPTVSSFSNLPDLKARINQIKTSQLISLDEPIIMLANQLKKDNAIEKYETGFISLSFNYLYIAKSSTNINKSIVNIIGSVMNSHENISFKVDPLGFRTSKTGGIVMAKMEPIIIEYQSITDFSAKLHLNDEDVESVTNRIKSKFPLITGFTISKVVTAPGKKERTISFEKINANYVFE